MMCKHTGRCGCGRRRGWWPTNVAKVTTTIFAVPELVRGVFGAVDAAHSRGMDGRTGTFRGGDTGDAVYHFSGYLAYAGTAMIPPGVTTNLRRSPYTILPATSGDIVRSGGEARGAVEAALAASVPGGWRR